MERKLTTILAADIAGFSRLIGADEEGTLAAQLAHRSELVNPLLAQHGGRVANTAGDSLLIEFPSAVEAVRCAIAVQAGMVERNADVQKDRQITYRIGINVGDVIAESDDLLGDGVNIAARLEALAPPGGIVISRSARDQVRDRLDLNLIDLGEVTVKNIVRPVRAFHVQREGEARMIVATPARRHRTWLALTAAVLLTLSAGGIYWRMIQPDFAPADPAKMHYSLTDKPAIAVLAFDNLTGDPEQSHVSDGLSEDIISALARLPGLLVIARNSSFTYKGKAVDIRQIAEEMSVRYVLEGSVQQSNETIRITAQLIDAISGHHVWTEKFDRPRADFFKVRDEITNRIARELNTEIVEGSAYIHRANLFESVDTWLIGRKALWHAYRWNAADSRIATDLINEVLAIEPDSKWAYENLGWRHVFEARFGWSDNPAESLRLAETYAQRAIALDDQYPGGYLTLSFIRDTQRRNEEAIAFGEKALELAPSDPAVMAILALAYQKDMQAERAIELFQRAVRVDRNAQGWVWENYGEALVMARRYEDAIPIYLETLKSAKGLPAVETHLGLAVAYDALEQEEKARAEVKAAIEIDPRYSVAFLQEHQRYKDQGYKDNWLATLKRLGLPDK